MAVVLFSLLLKSRKPKFKGSSVAGEDQRATSSQVQPKFFGGRLPP